MGGEARDIFGSKKRQTQVTGAGQGALQQSTPNWRGTALQYPHNAKKMRVQKKTHRHKGSKKSGLGCGKFEKKTTNTLESEGKARYKVIWGAGNLKQKTIFANCVPRFPLFPPNTLPLDNKKFLHMDFPIVREKKMGTMAGTRVSS